MFREIICALGYGRTVASETAGVDQGVKASHFTCQSFVTALSSAAIIQTVERN